MYRESCERLDSIKARFQVKVYWECDIRRSYKEHPEFNYFCKHFCLAGPWISPRKITQSEILAGISGGEIFGAVLCSVRFPDKLKQECDQFPPVICRKTVTADLSGPVMRQIATEMGYTDIKREQLVSCFQATDVLFSTSTIEWHLEHGIAVFDIKKVVQFTRKQPFKSFTSAIAEMRKRADVQKDALLFTTAEGLGNSSYGFTLYSAATGVHTKLCARDKAINQIRSNQFIALEELDEDIVEVATEKRKIVEGLPLHIGFQVYALSKVYMQIFAHDVLRKNLDPSKWEILASDTDSLCIALVETNINQCVRKSRQMNWKKVKPEYFVDNSSDEARARTSRIPLLFKEEIEAAGVFIAPSAKCYYAGIRDETGSKTVKTSAKGVNKRQNQLTERMYAETVFGVKSECGSRTFKFHDVKNVGFRTVGGGIFTYEQVKHGLSPIYLKREVLPNLFSTKTLENFE